MQLVVNRMYSVYGEDRKSNSCDNLESMCMKQCEVTRFQGRETAFEPEKTENGGVVQSQKNGR